MKIGLFLMAFLGAVLLSAPVLADSDPYEAYVRETFGNAFRAQRDNQILNPDACGSTAPVEGISGEAAMMVMESYYKSFSKNAGGGGAAPTNLINIGGLSLMGGGKQ